MGKLTMRLSKLPLAAALALSLFGLALPCQAQSGKSAGAPKSEDNYIYTFTDDDLIGDTLSTTTALIRVRKPAARVTLIRPRASFVAEMLKSVELM